MNTVIWIIQALVAFVFLFSGFNKAYFDEKTLVLKGQTGVEGLSKGFIKFIGVAEIFGAIALILPILLQKFTFLVPISAIILGLIMLPAAYIHFNRKENRNVVLNFAILGLCILIANYRI